MCFLAHLAHPLRLSFKHTLIGLITFLKYFIDFWKIFKLYLYTFYLVPILWIYFTQETTLCCKKALQYKSIFQIPDEKKPLKQILQRLFKMLLLIWSFLLLTRYQTVIPEHCTSNWDSHTLFSILIWSVLLLIGYQLLFLSIDHQIETDSLFSIVIWVILLLTRYQTVVPEHWPLDWDRLSI